MGIFFFRLVYLAEDLIALIRMPALGRPALAMLAVGAIGFWHGEIFGVGFRVIEEAATIGAKAIIFVAGGLEDGEKDLAGAKMRCKEALVALLPEAKAAGMTLAVEPLHPMLCASRSVLASLAEANDWCDEIAAGPELGLAIDVYHLWWDPNLAREIQRAGPRIAAYHINDWLHDTRDLRLDRGMMGDGAIDLARFRGLMEAAGYTGHHEVEIFSQRNWWRRDADEVVEVIKHRFATVC